MGKRSITNDDDKVESKPNKITKFLIRTRDIKSKAVIVVLENASLENIRLGRGLISITQYRETQANHQQKQHPDISNLRPDIVHQCLLMLMDSPLNLSGHLHVYIHTQKNILIQINPKTRIPRTFDRFCGLMVQLLENLSIKAATPNGEILLKVVKNPVTDHLPFRSRKFGTSCHAKLKLDPQQFISTIVNPTQGTPERAVDEEGLDGDGPNDLTPDPPTETFVFAVGAMAHGQAKVDYTEEDVCLSNYPLSAALTCAKLCSLFEQAWGIF